jgi:hypothetical protein
LFDISVLDDDNDGGGGEVFATYVWEAEYIYILSEE